MNEIIRNGCGLFALMFLAACQTAGPVDGLNLSTSTKPLTLIASVGKSIQKCWFKSGNPNFKSFRMANETASYSGRPRLLLVPKQNPGGLPSLVIMAQKQKGATRLQAFGPLLATKAGQGISTDLKNWTAGANTCSG